MEKFRALYLVVCGVLFYPGCHVIWFNWHSSLIPIILPCAATHYALSLVKCCILTHTDPEHPLLSSTTVFIYMLSQSLQDYSFTLFLPATQCSSSHAKLVAAL